MPLCRLSRWCTRNRQTNTAPWVHGKLLCRLDSLKINDLGILQLPDCGKLLMENNYQKLNYSFQWGLCTCFSNLTMIFVHIYQIGRLTNENWEQALAKSKLSCEGRRRWSREGKARAEGTGHGKGKRGLTQPDACFDAFPASVYSGIWEQRSLWNLP